MRERVDRTFCHFCEIFGTRGKLYENTQKTVTREAYDPHAHARDYRRRVQTVKKTHPSDPNSFYGALMNSSGPLPTDNVANLSRIPEGAKENTASLPPPPQQPETIPTNIQTTPGRNIYDTPGGSSVQSATFQQN